MRGLTISYQTELALEVVTQCKRYGDSIRNAYEPYSKEVSFILCKVADVLYKRHNDIFNDLCEGIGYKLSNGRITYSIPTIIKDLG